MKEISAEKFAIILRHFRSSGTYLASGITVMSGFVLIQCCDRVYLTKGKDFILMVAYADNSAEMVFSEFIKGSIKDLDMFF